MGGVGVGELPQTIHIVLSIPVDTQRPPIDWFTSFLKSTGCTRELTDWSTQPNNDWFNFLM